MGDDKWDFSENAMAQCGSGKSSLEKELSAKLTEEGCGKQCDNKKFPANSYCGMNPSAAYAVPLPLLEGLRAL